MVPYRDPKRYSWLLSVLVPASLVLGPLHYLLHGGVWRLWVPVGITYLLIPALDAILGEDRHNPPESAVPALDADRYYRRVTYALVPSCGFALFLAPGSSPRSPCRRTACWRW